MAPRKPRTDGKAKGKKYDSKATLPHPGFSLAPRAVTANGVEIGMPAVVLDPVLLAEAAKTHASYEHLGRIFNCSGKTIWANYKDIVEKARAEKKKELLAAMFDTAIRGQNPTMQIWLGKQYLGHRDVSRVEQTGADGKPIQTENKTAVIAYIPDNGRDPAPDQPELPRLGPGEGEPHAGLDPANNVGDTEEYPG